MAKRLIKIFRNEVNEDIINLVKQEVNEFIIKPEKHRDPDYFKQKLAYLVVNCRLRKNLAVTVYHWKTETTFYQFETGSLNDLEQIEADKYWEELDTFGGITSEGKTEWIPYDRIGSVKVTLINKEK